MSQSKQRVLTGTPLGVVPSYVRFMGRRSDAERPAYADLWDRLLTMRGDAKAAKAAATEMGLDPRAASWHGRKLKAGESYPTGAEMLEAAEAHVKATREAFARNPLGKRAQARRDKYHPGAPTLPGNRSPSA